MLCAERSGTQEALSSQGHLCYPAFLKSTLPSWEPLFSTYSGTCEGFFVPCFLYMEHLISILFEIRSLFPSFLYLESTPLSSWPGASTWKGLYPVCAHPPPLCVRAAPPTASWAPFFLTPVEDDILASEAAVPHSARQARRPSGCHIQRYSEVPGPVGIGQNVPSLGAQLLLLARHPHRPHRFWAESGDVARQQQTAGPGTGSPGQPGLGLHCVQQGKGYLRGGKGIRGSSLSTGSWVPQLRLWG